MLKTKTAVALFLLLLFTLPGCAGQVPEIPVETEKDYTGVFVGDLPLDEQIKIAGCLELSAVAYWGEGGPIYSKEVAEAFLLGFPFLDYLEEKHGEIEPDPFYSLDEMAFLTQSGSYRDILFYTKTGAYQVTLRIDEAGAIQGIGSSISYRVTCYFREPPTGSKLTLTLYFPDSQGKYLEPVQREVRIGAQTLAGTIIEELLRGRDGNGAGSPFPEGTRLLGTPSLGTIDVVIPTNEFKTKFPEGTIINETRFGDAVYVTLSDEFKTNYRGGSIGESLNLYAIVNSLCEIEGIEKVFISLKDESINALFQESLPQPITPNPGLVKR